MFAFPRKTCERKGFARENKGFMSKPKASWENKIHLQENAKELTIAFFSI